MARASPAGPRCRTRSDGGYALVGLLVSLLVLGGIAAISVVALSGGTTQLAPGPAAPTAKATTRGSASTTPGLPAISAASAAALAAERNVLTTAESAYFAVSGCYTDAAGLVGRQLLTSPPAHWTITTSGGACPSSYSLIPRSP